ncbi:Uncharacterized protein APZ42_030661 [Daphnia magna]|uniref:Uncharacterized protein n=1 Tax=Daphnia magna TaxID=35525 RepID=A0A164NQ87_9CRUS|nr:Uncharacterized protein APZ42_030661 [Daphnia magna]
MDKRHKGSGNDSFRQKTTIFHGSINLLFCIPVSCWPWMISFLTARFFPSLSLSFSIQSLPNVWYKSFRLCVGICPAGQPATHGATSRALHHFRVADTWTQIIASMGPHTHSLKQIF